MAHKYLTSRDFGDITINIYGVKESPVFVASEIGKALQQNICSIIRNYEKHECDYGTVEKDNVISDETLLIYEAGVYHLLKQIESERAKEFLEWFEEVCGDVKEGIEMARELKPNTGQMILSTTNLKILTRVSIDNLTIYERMLQQTVEIEKFRANTRAHEIERDIELSKLELEKMKIQLEIAKQTSREARHADKKPDKKTDKKTDKKPKLLMKSTDAAFVWIDENPPAGISCTDYYTKYIDDNPKGHGKMCFGRCLRQLGYRRKMIKNVEYWAKDE